MVALDLETREQTLKPFLHKSCKTHSVPPPPPPQKKKKKWTEVGLASNT